MNRYVCAALLPLLFVSSWVFAGPAAWTGQGPFGGMVNRVVVDPMVPSRLYATTRNGFFRSVDGGLSWQRAETGLLQPEPIRAVIALDPNVANALWLVDDAGRLYRSTDAAAHWSPTGDVAPGGAYTVTDLIAVKDAPGVLYESSYSNGLRKSVDGGAAFNTLDTTVDGHVLNIFTHLAADPTDPARLIATSTTDCAPGSPQTPVYRSIDAGASWAAVSVGGCNGGYHGNYTQIVFAPAGSDRVYALLDSMLFRSNDAGASFAATGLSANAVAVSPASADVLWLASVIYSSYESGFILQKSADGGTSATTFTTGLTTNGSAVPSVDSIAIHPDYPGTPRIWVGTNNAGIYQSSNDGASWSESNDGLAATLIRALAVHPNDGARMYAGFGDAFDPSPAFYRSNTVGNFVASNAGLNAYELRGMVIDPTTAATIGSTVIYAVGYGFDWSAGVPMHQNSGIYKSFDAGLSWSTLSGGLPANPYDPASHFAGTLRVIALDPRSCASPPPSGPCLSGPLQTAYIGGGGTRMGTVRQWRVMKTTDAGAHWASSEQGLPDNVTQPPGSQASDGLYGIATLVIDPVDTQTLYIGSFSGATDAAGNSTSPTVPNGVFKSTDGGAHWVAKNSGLPHYSGSTDSALDVLSLAIDPTNPQNLWASTKNFVIDAPGEIYKSTDGAEHWTLSNAGVTAPDTRALLVDPSDPSIIYAASGGHGLANPGGVYKSVDGGANWNSISVGIPSASALVLALDPVDSRVLHAGTAGGVYTITQLPDDDHDGVPDLIENAGPNGGDADVDGAMDSAQANVSTTALGLLGNNAWLRGSGDGVQTQLAQLRHVLSSGTVGGYFTVKIISGNCTHAVDVAPIDAGPYGHDVVAHHGTFDYPRGLVHFELPECSDATVDVTFNGANFGNAWSWRYYGPSTPGDSTTMGWHDAASVVTSRNTKTWRLHLAAGQFGSYRSAAAHSILFVGGPASNDTLFNDGFDD